MTRHIDADKLKDQFEPLDWYSGGMVISMINHAKTLPSQRRPKMTPERPLGNWLITDAWPHNVYCSNCYETYAQADWEIWEDGSLPRAFCPTCGADMRTQGLTCKAVKELGEAFQKGFEDGLNQEDQE